MANPIKLRPLASNMTVLILPDGTVILFSYETAVAALLTTGRRIVTSKKYGSTTTSHINKWIDGSHYEHADQSVLDSLLYVQSAEVQS